MISRVDNILGLGSIPTHRLIMLTILAFCYIAVTTLNSYLYFVQGHQPSLNINGGTAASTELSKKKLIVKSDMTNCKFPKNFDEALQTEENPNSKSYVVDKKNEKFYDLPLPERTMIGHIRPPTPKITFWVLTKINSSKNPNVCYFGNGINVFTEKSIRAIKSLLETF